MSLLRDWLSVRPDPRVPREPHMFFLALTVVSPTLASLFTIGHTDFALGVSVLMGTALLSNLYSAVPTTRARLLRTALLVLGVFVLPLVMVSLMPGLVLPVESYVDWETRLVVGITYLILLSAHLAGTPDLGLPAGLPIVPGLSTFGLNASRTFGPELMNAFLVFLIAALGLVCCDSFARHAERGLIPARAVPALLQRQCALIAGWGACLVVLSLMLSPVLAFTPELPGMSAGASTPPTPFRPPMPIYGNFAGSLELSGGSYEFSDAVWMRVRTPLIGTRWRGRVLRHYDGRSWRPEVGADLRLAERSGDWWVLDDSPSRGRVVREEFEPLMHLPPTLLASGQPLRARVEQNVFVQTDGVPRVRRNLQRGGRYTMESVVLTSTLAQWRRARAQPPEAIARMYLELPASAAPLRQIAEDVAGKETTPFRQAQAVESYLAMNCLYSLRSPTIPASEDAATYFVTVSREGACDLFASAHVLMCRALGIPARLVTGFNDSGERRGSSAIVRERDAHAWAEVYIGSYGWVPMDPTAASTIAPSTLQLLTQSLFSPNSFASLGEQVTRGLPLVAALAALAVFARTARRGPGRARLAPAARISRDYLRACQTLARRGLSRARDSTPWEFERLVRERLGAASQDFGELTQLVVRANFTAQPVGDCEVQRARALLSSLRKRR